MSELTIPTVQERRQIAALAYTSERQVLKVYRTPGKCRPSVVARICDAANKLGIQAAVDDHP